MFIAVDAIGSMIFGDFTVVGRAAGNIFKQPNSLGGFLALMISIFLPLSLVAGLSWQSRALFRVTVAVSLVGLALSLSRGSWLAVLVAFFYIAVTRGARTFIALALIACSVIWLLPESFFERIEYTFREKPAALSQQTEVDGSTQTRLDQWTALPGIWLGAPLLGHGFQSYHRVYGKITWQGYSRSAHSTLVQLAVEQGVAGVIAYAWNIGALATGARRLVRSASDEFLRALGTGFVAAVICLLILDLSGTRFYNSILMAYIWLLGGGLSRLAVTGATHGLRRIAISPLTASRGVSSGPSRR
jgi:O-antigen ligase